MKKWITLFFVLTAMLLSACSQGDSFYPVRTVKIAKKDKGFQLLVNGQPFYVKGAVAWQRFDLVKAYGGNAVRTRSSKRLLDLAAEQGIVCLVNLPVRAERDGMDYGDPLAVKKQFDHVIQRVDSLKNHPAVLMWALGNELDWIPPGVPYNRKVWDHLNDLATRIHEIDPNHPCLTTIGSVHEEVIHELLQQAPQLDLLGLNEYGNLLELAGWLREFGWDKPYVLTEWGPSGFWQVPLTAWDAPIEENSSMKADLYKQRYEEGIAGDPEMCLGSFVFLWNQHQERTHTWFGMFDREWHETEAVDVMRYEWTGKWPENLAARVDSMLVNGKTAYTSIYLEKGKMNRAQVFVRDPEGDSLACKWEILKEGTQFPYGGQGEKRGLAMDGLIENDQAQQIQFKTPLESGPYRLFVYVYDQANHFSTANVPFYVK